MVLSQELLSKAEEIADQVNFTARSQHFFLPHKLHFYSLSPLLLSFKNILLSFWSTAIHSCHRHRVYAYIPYFHSFPHFSHGWFASFAHQRIELNWITLSTKYVVFFFATKNYRLWIPQVHQMPRENYNVSFHNKKQRTRCSKLPYIFLLYAQILRKYNWLVKGYYILHAYVYGHMSVLTFVPVLIVILIIC